MIVINSGNPYYVVFDAINTGNCTKVRRLVTSLKTPDICDPAGVSILHYAVMTDQLSIVVELLGLGADCNTCTFGQKRTPLYSAHFNGNRSMIMLLEKVGAKYVNDSTGYFPFLK